MIGRYFGIAKEAKNWKSSIRSVIHTKPCFHKSEHEDGTMWWRVDVDIDPREQRRGLKKRTKAGSHICRPNTNDTQHKTTLLEDNQPPSQQYSDLHTENENELDTSILSPEQGAASQKRRKTK